MASFLVRGGGSAGVAAAPGRGVGAGVAAASSRLQDITVLGHHQHRHEVYNGQGQELGLLGLLLKRKVALLMLIQLGTSRPMFT